MCMYCMLVTLVFDDRVGDFYLAKIAEEGDTKVNEKSGEGLPEQERPLGKLLLALPPPQA